MPTRVGVFGGGPAGLLLARLPHRAGHRPRGPGEPAPRVPEDGAFDHRLRLARPRRIAVSRQAAAEPAGDHAGLPLTW